MNDKDLKAMMQRLGADDGQPTVTVTPAQIAKAETEARAAENERWQKIIALAEPRGQRALAIHLARTTGLCVDDMTAILHAAPRDVAASGLTGHIARLVRTPGHA